MSVAARQKQMQDRNLERLLTMEVGRPDYDAHKAAVSVVLAMPALRLFVPMSGRDSAGDATDMSGLGHTMTLGGNIVYNQYDLVTYAALPGGAGDFFTHADHADFDITGTETFEYSPGFAAGGWCYFYNAIGANEYMVTKWGAAPTRSYIIRRNAATGTIDFLLSTDGTNVANGTAGGTPATSTWFHWMVRFIPSTEMSVWVDGNETPDAVGIPASIWNGAAALRFGADGAGGSLTDARQSFNWICGAAPSDAQMLSVWNAQRAIFGI